MEDIVCKMGLLLELSIALLSSPCSHILPLRHFKFIMKHLSQSATIQSSFCDRIPAQCVSQVSRTMLQEHTFLHNIGIVWGVQRVTSVSKTKTKLRGLSPRANYTDRETWLNTKILLSVFLSSPSLGLSRAACHVSTPLPLVRSQLQPLLSSSCVTGRFSPRSCFFYHNYECSSFIQVVDTYLPKYTATHHRRLWSS
jgi:hypothetical protein